MILTEPQAQPSTLTQWAAALLRAFATKLDGITIPPPPVAAIARERLRDVQIALMDAEAEAERYTHTVAMLHARVARLQGTSSS